jgi:Uncharacterised protein, DegV family COG1307
MIIPILYTYMSDTDYSSTVIITDDLGLSNHSQVPLRSSSQYLEVELIKLIKKSESKQLYKVNSDSQNGAKFFYNLFDELLDDNDNIVYLTSSRELTESYDDAIQARNSHQLKDKIYIIDTKSISAGVNLVKNYLLKLLKEELTLSEAVPKVIKYLDKTKCKILLKNNANRWFVKPSINFDEHITISKKFKFANDAKTIVDLVLDQEFETSINQIYITYSLESLSSEATNIKQYLEKKLRYFDRVELVRDNSILKGMNNINGIGLYIG